MALSADIIDRNRLKTVLLAGQYVADEDILQAEKYAIEKGVSFTDALLALDFLTKDLLGQCIAEVEGLKYAEADSMPNDRTIIQKIPEALARSKRVVFISEEKSSVCVASDHPNESTLLSELKKIFPKKTLEIRYALGEHIDRALKFYEKPLSAQFAVLFSGKTLSIPSMVDSILDHAVDAKVSDIHFEPREKEVVVRFRIDGALLEAVRIPKTAYEKILNRIKVLARLPFDEHTRAEDGSYRHKRSEGEVNVRVSIVPTIDGEKTVLRLLSSSMTKRTGESLGLSIEDLKKVTEASKKPFGMVLVTGPTGSGKTTTLYAFLEKLNTGQVNITTIEDPVEYKVEGVNQMQTNSATDLTFARGLRSIVRQDPDIVLVGEIRDAETAEIAVNAALTGHLLLSTFHSNNAASTVPRLLEMGVEPYLLASTLELIVAQRLVRQICDACRVSYTLTARKIATSMPRVAPFFKNEKQTTLYRGEGCQACHMTGYRGRIGIFELISTSPEIQEMISKHPTSSDLWVLAKSQGSISMFEDGLAKVRVGVTTLEELLRVAEPERLET